MPAVPSAVPILGNSVNIPAGFPAAEKYPGPVNPVQYTDPGPEYVLEEPVAGPVGAPFSAGVPVPDSGGGIIDLSYTTGTDGPQASWDSNGGQAVTPNLTYPGAAPPQLHEDDGAGAVAANWRVVPAFIGKLIRRTPTGQTFNREFQFDPVTGEYIPAPNGRTNLDQVQEWDPAPGDGGGYAPWDPGYAERPILLNVAYQASPVNSVSSPYGVSGSLPDRSQWQAYPAQAYEGPPDPIVNQPSEPVASASPMRWVLG